MNAEYSEEQRPPDEVPRPAPMQSGGRQESANPFRPETWHTLSQQQHGNPQNVPATKQMQESKQPTLATEDKSGCADGQGRRNLRIEVLGQSEASGMNRESETMAPMIPHNSRDGVRPAVN